MPTTSFSVLTAFSSPRQISDVVNNVMRGKLNNTNEINLTASQTTTTVTDYNVGDTSVILFMPTNADGATELASGSMYVSAQTKNQFTITHSNSTTTRSFKYCVIG